MKDFKEAKIKKTGKKDKDYKALSEEYLAGWRKALADLDNYRKRTLLEKEAFLKLAKADLISQILPAVDNFSEAIKHIPQDNLTEPWVVGVTYINKQLVDVLKQN